MNKISTFYIAFSLLVAQLALAASGATPPKAGEKAPDFTLKTLAGQPVRLADLSVKWKVVLVILRGWPGYQCPLCSLQVQDYISSAARFAEAKARVVMVYPGPADGLAAHAKEFQDRKKWPAEFLYITDPDYTLVNAYGVRWEARNETAYPSTFVLDRNGVVRSAKVSHTHGDRSKAADIIEELKRFAEE